MADANNVMGELINNGDVVVIYDGAQGLFPEGGRRTGSLRYALLKLVWDLLRFQKPQDFKGGFNVASSIGMRDSISRIHLLTEQNSWLLQQLAKTANVDLTKMPGA